MLLFEIRLSLIYISFPRSINKYTFDIRYTSFAFQITFLQYPSCMLRMLPVLSKNHTCYGNHFAYYKSKQLLFCDSSCWKSQLIHFFSSVPVCLFYMNTASFCIIFIFSHAVFHNLYALLSKTRTKLDTR